MPKQQKSKRSSSPGTIVTLFGLSVEDVQAAQENPCCIMIVSMTLCSIALVLILLAVFHVY